MLITKDNDIVFRLGRNAKENFELIDDADPDDWWFHDDFEKSSETIVVDVVFVADVVVDVVFVVIACLSMRGGGEKGAR